jgi:hypothetical protein
MLVIGEVCILTEYLVFDIETGVIPDVRKFVEPVTSAPSNYKSEDAIQRYLEKANKNQTEKAALDVDLLRIASIGWWVSGTEFPAKIEVVSLDTHTEAEMLHAFWSVCKNEHHQVRTLMGYNILDFDVRALQRRSLYLGVPDVYYQVDRFRHSNIIDLQQILSYHGALTYRTLGFYCRRFGIDVPDPTGGGREMPSLIAMKDWASVKTHQRADIEKTARLASRIGSWFDVTAPVAAPAAMQAF